MAGDFDALKSKPEALGFAPDDVQELKSDRAGGVMPRVYPWLGKAGERVLNTGLEEVALTIKAISKYTYPTDVY